MILWLILKTFIPVSRIFDNKDDIFHECSNVQRQRNNILKKQNQKYYEILTYIQMRRKIIDDYCFLYPNDLFGINLLSELNVATF